VVADVDDLEDSAVVDGRSRLRFAVLLTVVAAVLATASAWTVWFTADIPDMTVRTRAGEMIELEGATAEVTARELVSQRRPALKGAVAAGSSKAQVPAGIGGLPVGHVLILAAAALAVAGYWLRLTAVFAAGFAFAIYGLRQYAALVETVLGARAGTEFIDTAAGGRWFVIAATVVTAGLVLCAIQAAVVNSRERQQLRNEAISRGEEPPPTGLQALWTMLSIPLQRIASIGQTLHATSSSDLTADRDGDAGQDDGGRR